MALTVSGQAGEIRWGWHRAATLGAWCIRPHEHGPTLEATVQEVDTFAVSQQPLRFVARHWVWPIVTLEIAAGTLNARLGPRDKGSSHGVVR